MQMQTQVKPNSTLVPSFTPMQIGLQRKCDNNECEERRKKRLTLQRSSTNQAEPSEVPPIVHEVLRSPGQPLDRETRAFMESRFGHDFSKVKVHMDAKAVESARAINALAYTVGRDMVFGDRQYRSRTSEGRRLFAHELAHVMQQSNGASCNHEKLAIGPSNDLYEQEADRTAKAIMRDQMPTLHSKAGAVHAQPVIIQRQVAAGNPASATHSLPSGIEDLKGHDFDRVFRLDTISIIEFRTDCCIPCEELAQWLSGTAQTYRDVKHPFRVRFYSVNAYPMVVDPAGHCLDELASPEADENRALGRRLGLAPSFPQVRIYLEGKLEKEYADSPKIEHIEDGLKEVIEDASMSGFEKGFHLGLGRSVGGWILPFVVLPVALLAGLGGALFGKEKGTKELSQERVQKVKDFNEGKIKAEELDHSLAEDIVNFWVDHHETYKLGIYQRRMLIKNLIAGFTGDAEERAILKIIENSTDAEILQIFSLSDPDAPNLVELEAEFQGAELEYLRKLLDRLRERFPVNPPLQKTMGLLIDNPFVQGVLANAFRTTHKQEPGKPPVSRECTGVFIAPTQGGSLDKEVKCEDRPSAGTNILAIEALKKRGKGFKIVGSFHTHPVSYPPHAREAPGSKDIELFLMYPSLEGAEHYVVGPLVTYVLLQDGSLRVLGNTADLLHVERIQPKSGQISTLELG